MKGIKATRVTGSTTKLESDKETRKKKREEERDRGERLLLRDRWAVLLKFAVPVPCWMPQFLTSFKEGHCLGLFLSVHLTIYLPLFVILNANLSATLSHWLYVHKIACMYLPISVPKLRQSAKAKIWKRYSYKCSPKCFFFLISMCMRVLPGWATFCYWGTTKAAD